MSPEEKLNYCVLAMVCAMLTVEEEGESYIPLGPLYARIMGQVDINTFHAAKNLLSMMGCMQFTSEIGKWAEPTSPKGLMIKNLVIERIKMADAEEKAKAQAEMN